MFERFGQFPKAYSPMVVTVSGMVTLFMFSPNKDGSSPSADVSTSPPIHVTGLSFIFDGIVTSV